MIASYALRLLAQSLTCFFLVHLFTSVLTSCFTKPCIQYAECRRAAFGRRLLVMVSFAPLFTALSAAFLLAVPSYVRLEPETQSERIGPKLIALALLGLAVWLRPLVRVVHALVQLNGYSAENRIALAGFLRPRILLSRSILDMLSRDELQLVLQHEHAHLRAGDNWIRLFMLALPEPIPFLSLGAALRRAYRRLAEWAADDCACASDERRRLTLAQAIVRIAQQQTDRSNCVLATPLAEHDSDLARRIERLLSHSPGVVPPPHLFPLVLVFSCIGLLVAGLHFLTLPLAHRLLESLAR